MNKKIVHCTYLEQKISSISNHCRDEMMTAIDEKMPWDVYLHISEERIKKTTKIALFSDRLRYYFQVFRFSRKYEIVMLRYIPADPFFALLVLFAGQKIHTVHHTKEKTEILNKFRFSLKSIIKFLTEIIFGPLCRTFARGFLVKTNEIGTFQVIHSMGKSKSDLIIYSNAGQKKHRIEDRRSDFPTFLFIGSNLSQPWQGLDILLQLFNDLQLDYRFHVIGEASFELEEEMRENPQITYHGVLSEKQIIGVASYCDIGLSVFALFRNNMSEACSLKVRQYLNLGLPVYLPHKDVFPRTFNYCKYGSGKASDIIKYCFRAKKWSRDDVIKESQKYISRKQIMQRTIRQLRRNLELDVSFNSI